MIDVSETSVRGIIFFSIFDWSYHSHGHSDMQLARMLARRNPVLFVNSIGMRFPRRGTATAPLRRILRKVRSAISRSWRPDPDLDLTVFTPLFWPTYAGLSGRINMWAVRAQVAAMARHLGFSAPTIIVTLPTYGDVARAFPGSLLFYNRSDRHADFADGDRVMLAAKEAALFAGADAVLYASQHLYTEEAGRAAGAAVLIGHGVDTAMFSPIGIIANDVARIAHPRVGFFGDLRAHSIDFDLLDAVAHLCPDIQFILGGSQLDDLAALRRLSNLHILDACPHAAMPDRWRGLDAAILPYRLTSWQYASEPIKLNEILAMGLPAVGTSLPAFARRDGIRIADRAEEFAQELRAAIAGTQTRPDGSDAIRSWEDIADQIELLAQSLPPPRRAA